MPSDLPCVDQAIPMYSVKRGLISSPLITANLALTDGKTLTDRGD